MAITVREIRDKDFTRQVRGYNVDEVDEFLDELADQMDTLIRENRDMLNQLQSAAEASVKEVPVVIFLEMAEAAVSSVRCRLLKEWDSVPE